MQLGFYSWGMHIQVWLQWLQAGWGAPDGNCGRLMGRFMGMDTMMESLCGETPGELAIEVANHPFFSTKIQMVILMRHY